MESVKFSPQGLGKKLALGALSSGVHSLYQEVKGGKGSFRNDLTSRVNEYYLKDKDLGIGGSVKEIAAKYGLSNDLDAYIKKNVLGGLKGRLARLLDITTSIKDSLEDVVEAGDILTVGQTTPSQVPLYLASQSAYTILSGILGFTSGTYKFSRKGISNYLADSARGYLGAAANIVPILGSFIELGTNFDNKRPRIAEAASRKTAYWLVNKVRAQKGLGPLKSEDDLEQILRSSGPSIKDRAKEKFREYGDKIKSKIPLYGSDFARNPAYATV
jgi:hypothetical protein